MTLNCISFTFLVFSRFLAHSAVYRLDWFPFLSENSNPAMEKQGLLELVDCTGINRKNIKKSKKSKIEIET